MSIKDLSGMILGIAFLTIFVALVLPSTVSWPVMGPISTNVGMVKWEGRTLEVLFQGFILFSGVVAILMLLGSRKSRGPFP